VAPADEPSLTGPTFPRAIPSREQLEEEAWKRDARLVALGAGPVLFVVLLYWLMH
jgi:hypothetical protein